MIQSLSDGAGMLNLPDLILLLFLIWSVINGARRGFIMSVIGLVGRIAVVLGACWLAKTWAPTLAGAVVTPLWAKPSPIRPRRALSFPVFWTACR